MKRPIIIFTFFTFNLCLPWTIFLRLDTTSFLHPVPSLTGGVHKPEDKLLIEKQASCCKAPVLALPPLLSATPVPAQPQVQAADKGVRAQGPCLKLGASLT